MITILFPLNCLKGYTYSHWDILVGAFAYVIFLDFQQLGYVLQALYEC